MSPQGVVAFVLFAVGVKLAGYLPHVFVQLVRGARERLGVTSLDPLDQATEKLLVRIAEEPDELVLGVIAALLLGALALVLSA
jgi:hypothetical protein